MDFVFVCPDAPGQLDGPSSWICRLVPALLFQGLTGRVLLLEHGAPCSGALFKRLEFLGVPVERETRRSVRLDTEWLLQKARELRPKHWVANYLVPAAYAAHYMRLHAWCKTYVVLHSDEAYYHRLFSVFALGMQPSAFSDVIAVSAHLETTKRPTIPTGVELHRIPCGAPCDNLKAIPSEQNELRLLYVGRFDTAQKRILDVVSACCKACQEVDGVTADFLGSGVEKNEMARIIDASGAGAKVRILDAVPPDSVQEIMSHYHVIVLLSNYEGIPISLMEAMAAGLVPVVSLMDSGVPELVKHGVTGLVVEDRSVQFVSAVRELRDDPKLRIRLAEAARAHVVENFSSASNATRWASLMTRNSAERWPDEFQAQEKTSFPEAHWRLPWVDCSMRASWFDLRFLLGPFAWTCYKRLPYVVRMWLKQKAKTGN